MDKVATWLYNIVSIMNGSRPYTNKEGKIKRAGCPTRSGNDFTKRNKQVRTWTISSLKSCAVSETECQVVGKRVNPKCALQYTEINPRVLVHGLSSFGMTHLGIIC